MDLNAIGYFQFDNLIQNRIPFVFVNLGVDFSDWYSGLNKTHLEAYALNVDASQVLSEIGKKNLPLHTAILVICPDGTLSKELCSTLENSGFSNVFYAKGGFTALAQERETQND